jgi:putative CocE/NonD family hydrolase
MVALMLSLLWSNACLAGSPEPEWSTPDKFSAVDFQWGVGIPMRDGIRLNATVYRPENQKGPLPCIFTLTPYISQSYHDRGMYFAAHGYVFLAVDARGRGNSEGSFTPLLQEANDSPQVVEWLARQPYCNGKIAMWGGSYAGYDQWATAKEFPPHLTTIVPVASPRPGVDFPALYNIHYAYDMQWSTLTSGHTGQESIFDDDGFWKAKFGEMYVNHRPYRDLDAIVGNPSPSFQKWLTHPTVDAYWDSYNPAPQQFARIDLPILTITGQYDGDQPGALSFYREHLEYASAAARAKHYLIIGPWDHYGTRTPDVEYGGVQFGNASLIDMNLLLKDWYDWTMKDGPKPAFLKNKVAYYFFGDGVAEWRYANSLAAVTAEMQPMYLASANGNADDVFAAGSLTAARPDSTDQPDHYVYDPLDVTEWDPAGDGAAPHLLTNPQGLLASSGKLLIYHTQALAKDTDLAGFFKLSAWISLDQPDTDIAATVYAIGTDGHSEQLATHMLRARYRKGLRKVSFVKPGMIERYDFDHFTFIARHLAKGSRLRLVIGPVNSRYWEKNYNSEGVVADESGKDARTVTVTLHHDAEHSSALYLPIAAKADALLAH